MTRLVVNGREKDSSLLTISYEDAVLLAEGDPDLLYTVAYHRPAPFLGEAVQGTLVPGEWISAQEGLILNVFCTTNG